MQKPLAATIALLICMLVCICPITAQSPPNLSSDIQWDEDASTAGNQQTYSGTTAIQNAFNNARRQEETQKSLTANALGNLTLPGSWGSMSNNDKALFLINAERVARGGVNYSGVTPLGLPFEAADAGITTAAQNHANYLKATSLFTHTGSGSTAPFQRVQAVYAQNTCSEFLARSENIAIFARSGNSPNPLIVERAVFAWIYTDASASWGHREACLLQDKDLTNNNSLYGFKNNYGSASSEGFIGIGTAGATDGSYAVFNGTTFPSQDVVVLKLFDPVASATASTNSCAFSAPLPVELLYFRAEASDKQVVKLSWITVSEKNASHFIVERSLDLERIEEIAIISAAGTTTEKQQYEQFDKAPHQGLSYYRLRQIDFDTKASTYKWVSVSIDKAENQVVLAPNPSNGDRVDVWLSDAWTAPSFRLIDLIGRTYPLKATSKGQNKFELNFQEKLISGLYLLAFEQDGKTSTQKLLVR